MQPWSVVDARRSRTNAGFEAARRQRRTQTHEYHDESRRAATQFPRLVLTDRLLQGSDVIRPWQGTLQPCETKDSALHQKQSKNQPQCYKIGIAPHAVEHPRRRVTSVQRFAHDSPVQPLYTSSTGPNSCSGPDGCVQTMPSC